jgi:hypothetical protein
MHSNNKFAKMDSIANLIKTILEADTKAKMEELKGGQHKIDKNKNNKIDAQDFAILRGEKKAMKKEQVDQNDKETEELSEGRPFSRMHRIGRYGTSKRSPDGYGTGTSPTKTSTATQPSKPAAPDKELKKEEYEQVDEAKEPGFKASYGIGRKGATAKKPETYGKRVQGKGYDKPENERKAPEGKVPMTSLMPGYSDKAARLAAVQAKGRLVKGSAQSAKQVEKEEVDPNKTVTDTLRGREKSSSNPNLSKKVMMDVPGNVKEEAEQIDERTLTKPETAEKERIVKGMKKSLAGFKKRYGERAKSVMYATATKAAKERK